MKNLFELSMNKLKVYRKVIPIDLKVRR